MPHPMFAGPCHEIPQQQQERARSPCMAGLIDADNAPPFAIEGLLAEVATKYGVACGKRIFVCSRG